MSNSPSQKAQDEAEQQAAAIPEESRDVFAPAPDIEAGPFKVRRFVDRDFMFLSALGHPLNSFAALAEGSYAFEPTGELAWQLCWLLTRPIAEIKEQFMQGAASVKEAADNEFGELPIYAIGMVMEAIVKQMTIYASSPRSPV